MIKNKKLAVVLLALLLCLCLVGCGNNSANNDTTTSTTSITISNKINISTTTSDAGTTPTTSRKNASTTTTSTTTKKATTTSSKKTKPSTTKAKKVPNSAKSTTKAKSTSSKNNVCYLTIECKDILTNINDLKPGHERYVPSDGYIVRNYIYTISNEVSVYDVLKKCCEDNNIILNSENTQYSKYVAGINNIDEFDCGRYSGWLYYVNGSKPAFSCDKYIVKPNDKIVFHYTCNYE